MSLDTSVISAYTKYLYDNFLNSRISKVSHPEKDELNLTLKNSKSTNKLIISSNPQFPLIYVDNLSKKENPSTASNFCMVLRKHILNGRIIDIKQINRDRVIEIIIEHYDELGDLKTNRLIMEFMGKHSNVILVNEKDRILDSIKHIDASTSSQRLIFPGANYFLIDSNKKPIEYYFNNFSNYFNTSTPVFKNLVNLIQGVTPKIAQEVCFNLNLDSNSPSNTIQDYNIEALLKACNEILDKINKHNFVYKMYFSGKKPIDYTVINFNIMKDTDYIEYENINSLISDYYKKSLLFTQVHEKTINIRSCISNNIKRLSKKLNIWNEQLKDCMNKDKYKLYGELLLAYSYLKIDNKNFIEVENYYDNNKIIKINIDENKTLSQNSQRYYEKYNKLKRTEIITEKLVNDAENELNYLFSIEESVKNIQNNDDINEITRELFENGYMKNFKGFSKKKIIKSKPLKYTDSLGFIYYVGKNNIQNEYVTFKLAENNDWWFHIKNLPGSHVIVRNNTVDELPDEVFINAASLAAYYSSNRDLDKVEVDYIQRKFIKKPKNNHVGMVIYHTNYSIVVNPNIDNLKLIQ